MLHKISVITGIFIVVAVLLFRLTGCSLIGLGIGAISDANTPNYTPIPGWEVGNIEPGTEIYILLKNGDQVSGNYIGLEHVPEEEYDEKYVDKYAESREILRDEVILPIIGEFITLIMVSGKEHLCYFQGFDSQHIWVRMAGNTETEPASLNLIKKIEVDQGSNLEPETVRRLIVLQRLPSLSPYISAIAIESYSGKMKIAINKVQTVQKEAKKSHALEGFLIGAVIDILLLVIIKQSMPKTVDLGF